MPEIQLEPECDYLVTPERIGRHKDIEPFIIHLREHYNTRNTLARALHNEVGKYLVSHNYEVYVTEDEGHFTVGSGRYGRGTLERMP